eukprot:g3393.t1
MPVSLIGDEYVLEKTLTKIASKEPGERFIELAPFDITATSSVVSVSLFFETDIKAEVMKRALQEAGESHYELFGRLVPHPTQCFQLGISPEAWFPFIDQHSSLSAHDALAKFGQMKIIPSEDGDDVQTLPFYSSSLDYENIKKGSEPLFQCKLTHFIDGYCGLGLSFSHSVVDGQRFINFVVDVGKVARDIEIKPRIHDRNYMWPDEYLKKISVPNMDTVNYPRVVDSAYASIDITQFASIKDTVISHLLHFSEDVIQQIKKSFSEHLAQGEYLSTSDIITAIVWLLHCEIEVSDSENISLTERLKESMSFTFIEAHNNGATFIPSNIVGNAIMAIPIKYEEIKANLGEDSCINLVLNAALSVRKAILTLRENEAVIAEHLAVMYQLASNAAMIQQLLDPSHVLYMSSWSKLGVEDINFGGGPPCFVDGPLGVPHFPKDAIIVPGLKNGGVTAAITVNKSKQDTLFNSRVLNECVPAVNFIFGKNLNKPEFNIQL